MALRIMLSEKIGAEGLGLYQLVMSVYAVFASLVTSGICFASTRVFGEYAALGQPAQARYCVEKYLTAAFISGTLAALLLFSLTDVIASGWLGDERAALPLKLLSPSLPLMAVSSCIRGYFTARRKSLPTSSEQLLEQGIEIGGFLLLFSLVQPADLGEACALSVTGTTAAELISLFYAAVWFRRDIRRAADSRVKVRGLARKTLPILLPVCANSLTRSGLSAAENALVPYGLRRYGHSGTEALSSYGVIAGMTMPVLVFPSVFVIPLAALILPEIAEAHTRHSHNGVRHMTERAFGLTLLYALPVMVLMIAEGEPLCRMIYGNSDAGRFLMVLAPVIPLMYLDSVVDAILKGLNEQTSYFVFNTIDSAVRVLLTVILLPFFGNSGLIMVILVSEVLNTLLSIGRLMKVTSFRIRVGEQIILPLIGILTPCLMLRLLPVMGNEAVTMIIRITLSVLLYALLMLSVKKNGSRRKLPAKRSFQRIPGNNRII